MAKPTTKPEAKKTDGKPESYVYNWRSRRNLQRGPAPKKAPVKC